MTARQLMIYQAIEEVLGIFVETEIGTDIPFNNEVISDYLCSNGCIADYYAAKNLEECCAIFTEHILNGYPVWRMLELPEWTMAQMEKEFREELDREEEKRKKKYKCLTCKYYKETITGIGAFLECEKEKEVEKDWRNRGLRKRKESLKLKVSCKDYIRATESELNDNVQKVDLE